MAVYIPLGDGSSQTVSINVKEGYVFQSVINSDRYQRWVGFINDERLWEAIIDEIMRRLNGEIPTPTATR